MELPAPRSSYDYPMDPSVYLAVAAVLVVLGVAGTVLPVLPGILFVFGGLFLAAWAQDFTRVGWVGLTLIGVLALLAFAEFDHAQARNRVEQGQGRLAAGRAAGMT